MPREDVEKLTQLIADTPDPATLTAEYVRDLARRESLQVSEGQIESLLSTSRGELSEADLGEVVGGAGFRIPGWFHSYSASKKEQDREF